MGKTFDEFYEILKKDRKYSSWSQKQDFEKRHKELTGEVEELKAALLMGNPKEIEDELGDVLWDTLFLILLAEEKGYCTPDSVIKNSIEKLKRRKPWIFDGKTKSIEEEEEHWQKVKKIERENKNSS